MRKIIYETYEPLVQYKDENLNTVLSLPKKVFYNEDINLYKLHLTFVETTYLELEYKTVRGKVLLSCTFNLSDNVSKTVDKIFEYLDKFGCLYIE